MSESDRAAARLDRASLFPEREPRVTGCASAKGRCLRGSLISVPAALLVGALLCTAGAAFAQPLSKRGMGREIGNKAPYAFFEKKGLFPTGLEAVFPDSVDCPGVSSPYGSKTRYDGSARKNDHYGYHNGFDISLDSGTPLLAIADGDVIHTGTAGRLVGNFIWVRFAPEATGLPVHVFARYQHLEAPSPLKVGDRVTVGQTIGRSGNTGTTGGHFGARGYPHLHLNLLIGDGPEYTVDGQRPTIGPEYLTFLDPLGLYIGKPVSEISNRILRDLPDGGKTVPVPVKTSDGRILPEGSRVIWPVACGPS